MNSNNTEELLLLLLNEVKQIKEDIKRIKKILKRNAGNDPFQKSLLDSTNSEGEKESFFTTVSQTSNKNTDGDSDEQPGNSLRRWFSQRKHSASAAGESQFVELAKRLSGSSGQQAQEPLPHAEVKLLSSYIPQQSRKACPKSTFPPASAALRLAESKVSCAVQKDSEELFIQHHDPAGIGETLHKHPTNARRKSAKEHQKGSSDSTVPGMSCAEVSRPKLNENAAKPKMPQNSAGANDPEHSESRTGLQKAPQKDSAENKYAEQNDRKTGAKAPQKNSVQRQAQSIVSLEKVLGASPLEPQQKEGLPKKSSDMVDLPREKEPEGTAPSEDSIWPSDEQGSELTPQKNNAGLLPRDQIAEDSLVVPRLRKMSSSSNGSRSENQRAAPSLKRKNSEDCPKEELWLRRAGSSGMSEGSYDLPSSPTFSSHRSLTWSISSSEDSLFPFLNPLYQRQFAVNEARRKEESNSHGRPLPVSSFKCPGCKKELTPLSTVNAHLSKCFDRPERLRFLGRKMGTPDAHNVRSVPPYLVASLKPHQLEAAAFLWSRLGGPLNPPRQQGCVLADAMGLGKTLSTVAFVGMCWRELKSPLDHSHPRPASTAFTVCVLCPATVVAHWAREFQQWLAPDHRPPLYLYHSGLTGQERVEVLRDWGKGGGVLLSTYELYRGTVAGAMELMQKQRRSLSPVAYRLLCSPGPKLLILDEGHRVKTEITQTSSLLRNCTSPRRVVLTGYPLQNNLMEYWSMLDIACPGFLGSHQDFRISFENPISKGLELQSQPILQEIAAARMHALSYGLKEVVLRRESSAILLRGARDLPYKKSMVVRVGLSALQEDIYLKVAAFVRQIRWDPQSANVLLFECHHPVLLLLTHPLALYRYIVKRQQHAVEPVDESKDPSQKARASTEEVGRGWFFHENKKVLRRFKVIDYLSKLDSEGELPLLWEQEQPPGDPQAEKEANTEAGRADLNGNPTVRKRATDIQDHECLGLDVNLSPKLMVLLELLEQFKALNEKTLIFSQSLKSLDLIELFLEVYKFGDKYLRMDGKTPELERQNLIAGFQDPASTFTIFLISTKAGGEGITLTAASRVIIFDTSFNPSNDVQASYRSYRFGQTRPVFIYRLLTAGTLEEKVYANQIYKMALSHNIVDGKSVETVFSKDLRKALDYDADAKNRPLSGSAGLLQSFGQRQGLPLNSFGDDCLENVLQKYGGSTIVETFEQEEMLEESKLDSVQFTEKQKSRAFDALHRLDERAKREESSKPTLSAAELSSLTSLSRKAAAVKASTLSAPDWEEHEQKKRRLVRVAETNDTGSLKNKEMILGQDEEFSSSDLDKKEKKPYENVSVKSTIQPTPGHREHNGPSPRFGGVPECPKDDRFFVQSVVIPNSLIGMVIGRKGANIKSMQEQSNTFMRVVDCGDSSIYKSLVIEAQSPEQLEEGKKAVIKHLHNISSRDSVPTYQIGAPTVASTDDHIFRQTDKRKHNQFYKQKKHSVHHNQWPHHKRAQHANKNHHASGAHKLVVGNSILPQK